MDRQRKLLIISKRLIIFAALSLVAAAIVFAVTYLFDKRFLVSWFAFECGLIGGFVSIQQRLRKIADDELTFLSESWTTILVIPIYGGIFSLVLYLLFLSGLVRGHLFPEFWVPAFHLPPTTEDIRIFLTRSYPLSAADFAKFAFWSFCAGFIERLVPQIIQKVTSKGEEST